MTTWQPGDPVDPHGGAPELYCACGARAAGPTLNHGMPCPECGQPMTFDPSACLDRWRQLRDDAVNALTRAQTVTAVRTTALTLRQLAGWCIDGQLETTEQELRSLADQVDQIETGWCCPMCEEAVCDGGCPLEHVRDHLADLTYDGHQAEQAFADAAGIDLSAAEPDHHAWTSHGHPCCHRPGPPTGTRPASVVRCGGPAICSQCAHDAGRAHVTASSPVPRSV